MSAVKKGDKIKVHYTGKLYNGEVFDSSVGRTPLEFEVGGGMMIAGFDAAVYGMKVGDKKVAEIPAKDAYGVVNKDMITEIPRANMPTDLEPEVGQQLSMQQPNGQSLPVIVTAVSEDGVTIDANHQLAGKDLTFEIELVEIN
ncbi:MAG: peptidylprolyl isomerase [Bacteroidota bacterium]